MECLLDWDNEGVEKDLIEIAKDMLDWEEKLPTPFGLTATDISDIKAKCPDNKPELQRYEISTKTWMHFFPNIATYVSPCLLLQLKSCLHH